VGARAQAVLVAEAEAAEVLPDDALDDLGREAAAHVGDADTDRGRRRVVRAGQGAVAPAEALPIAAAGAVAIGADGAEAAALAAATAALADPREAEAAGAEGVADVLAPHVAPGGQGVIAQRHLATPGDRHRARVAAGARVEDADDAPGACFVERRLASG